MGFTRYWRVRPGVEGEGLLRPLPDMRRILAFAESQGTAESGTECEIFCFNGVGDEALEPFFWPPEDQDDDGWLWGFCKTDLKPYDVVVAACLQAVRDHLGEAAEISADAGPKAWVDGARLFASVLGREPPTVEPLPEAKVPARGFDRWEGIPDRGPALDEDEASASCPLCNWFLSVRGLAVAESETRQHMASAHRDWVADQEEVERRLGYEKAAEWMSVVREVLFSRDPVGASVRRTNDTEKSRTYQRAWPAIARGAMRCETERELYDLLIHEIGRHTIATPRRQGLWESTAAELWASWSALQARA